MYTTDCRTQHVLSSAHKIELIWSNFRRSENAHDGHSLLSMLNNSPLHWIVQYYEQLDGQRLVLVDAVDTGYSSEYTINAE